MVLTLKVGQKDSHHLVSFTLFGNHMRDTLPRIIRIMPDYGPCYASDEDGCAFDVTGYFDDHPEIKRIREIENYLYGFASWIDSGEPDNSPDFPWNELDEKGLSLTKELSALLGDIGIPIIYCIHYNNPKFEHVKEIDLSVT